MERRRFIPTGDGLALESRVLLAASASAKARAAVTNPSSSSLPESVQQRLQRIQNLPFFLNSLQAGRFINPDAMHEVQANLTLLMTRLKPAPPSALTYFNQQLRKVGARASISESDANAMSFAFNRVLASTGADPQIVANLTAAMTVFAKTDAASVNPAFLITNDYSLVLQTALGTGRPLSAPAKPALITADRSNGQALVSKTSTPTLTGTYQPNSVMTIRDANGSILGTAATLSSGQYSVKIARPLPDGSYKLTISAVDSGFISQPSKVFTLKIKTPANSAKIRSVPAGPMAL